MHHPSSHSDWPDATVGGAMTVSEFCHWAGIGRTKMYAEVKSGRLQLRKIGTKTVIFRSEAHRWMGALPIAMAPCQSPKKKSEVQSGLNQGADLDAETA